MFVYPKILRRKDLKKIDKYPCDEKIKEAYLNYLTNYSFKEFVDFCSENQEMDMDDLLFKFTDKQLEKFEPNSLIWISHVMLNFMIYFDVNLDYGHCYDAFASALQLAVLSTAMKMAVDKISFEELPLPAYSGKSLQRLFERCSDFEYDLYKDCGLAYRSFNEDFDFSEDEFYLKVKNYFDAEIDV